MIFDFILPICSQDEENVWIWEIKKYKEEQNELNARIARYMNILEIEKLKQIGLQKDIRTLEGQIGVQTKFNKMLTEENDSLSKQNKELEDMLVSERRVARSAPLSAVNGTSERQNVFDRNTTLLKANQETNEKVLALEKENAAMKSVIESFSIATTSEHNYSMRN